MLNIYPCEMAVTDTGTAAEQALDHLRHTILTRGLQPGQRVGQDEMAAQLKMSIAPVREALRILEQEGQVTYKPRRGYFVAGLSVADLEELYELRQLLEERAVLTALPFFTEESLERVAQAAADCAKAAVAGDVIAELAANKRFHFALTDSVDQPHTMRLIRILWDSTECYRALYYSSPEERMAAVDAHERILEAARAGDADRLVLELGSHRGRALEVLRIALADSPGENHRSR